MLKLRLALPFLVLALSLVACGKKDDPAVVDQGVAAAPAGTYYPWPGGGGSYPDIQTFCQAYYYQGAQLLSGGICKFDGTVSAGSTYIIGSYYPRDYSGNYIQVTQNDTVMVASSGSITADVGGYSQSPLASFVATASGYLHFQASFSWSPASVSQIRIKRCYVMSAGNVTTATCP